MQRNWAVNSVGRVFLWRGKSQEFESLTAHHLKKVFLKDFFLLTIFVFKAIFNP